RATARSPSITRAASRSRSPFTTSPAATTSSSRPRAARPASPANDSRARRFGAFGTAGAAAPAGRLGQDLDHSAAGRGTPNGPRGRDPRLLDVELPARARGTRRGAPGADGDARHQRAPLLGTDEPARGGRERAAQGHVHIDHQLVPARGPRDARPEAPEPRA